MYRKIMIGSGIAAALVTVAYAVAAGMAGLEDVELSSRVGSICLTLILGLSLVSYSAWLVKHANRESAHIDLPPILFATIERSAHVIADAVVEQIAERMQDTANDVADRAYCRTVTAFREIVTGPLVTEQLNAAAQRIHRYGMISEAAGRATVHSIRRD